MINSGWMPFPEIAGGAGMKISEHANYLLNEFGRLQFDYAAYCKPNGESLRNEARNNLETYIAELEATVEIHADISNAYEKRISEIVSLSNKANAKLQVRIAELEALVERLIEIGDWATIGMVISNSYSLTNETRKLAEDRHDEWRMLVKGWKSSKQKEAYDLDEYKDNPEGRER